MRHLYKQAHKSVWDRKPPSKRVNFKKMCVEHPFEAAFESLSKVDTMVEGDGPMYSLIQGSTLSTLLENTDTYTTSIKKAAQRRHLDLDYTFECSQLLAKVRVHYFHGGKPSSNALIYAFTDEALYQHLTQYIHRQPQPLKQSKRQLKEMQDMEGENKVCSIILSFHKHSFTYSNWEIQVNKELPSKLDHIGYITNGGFSLALGHGFGIGACSIDGLKNIKHLDEK
jgi:ribonuclease P/MRP protein subunit POP1